ncbi:MAG: zinc ribbon domain-containing protein [Lachnospiraceae bacterium]|nr:zinc ribbon domain-containing protein [Lachnospiraceae bacterium]
MFCDNCGKEIPDDSAFCPECGNAVAGRVMPSLDDEITDSSLDALADANVNMAVGAYITWIGFIIAVCSDSKNNSFNRFHLNQALIINIAATVGFVLPLIGFLILIAAFVYAILGIVSASNKSMKALPLLDKIKLM